jgi:hypothetical protein
VNWREVWREHVKKTGDFWVDRNYDHYQVIDEKERQLILRKKSILKKRSAQVVKATVNGRVVGQQSVGDETHVNYRHHTALLVKQGKDHFYIEEQDVEKKGIIQGNELKKEQTLTQEKSYEDRMRIQLPPVSPKTSRSQRFSYDRSAAVKYAERWWNSRNPAYRSFDVDCTSYVSQCVHAGGAPMVGHGNKNKGWWYSNGKEYSYSWAVAHALRWYLSSDGNALNAVEVEDPSQLVPGDLICYDFDGNDHWDHNTIVTGQDWYGMPLVNAHSIDSRNRYWAYEDSHAYTENIQYKFFHIDAD